MYVRTYVSMHMHVFTYVCMYTVNILCKRLPYLGATELHPIWVNFNPDICVPG